MDGIDLLCAPTAMITLRDGMPRGIVYSVLALATYQRAIKDLARAEFASQERRPTPAQSKLFAFRFKDKGTEKDLTDLLFADFFPTFAADLEGDSTMWLAVWAWALTAEWREDNPEPGMTWQKFRRLLPVWPDPAAQAWQTIVTAEIMAVHSIAVGGGENSGNDAPKKKRTGKA